MRNNLQHRLAGNPWVVRAGRCSHAGGGRVPAIAQGDGLPPRSLEPPAAPLTSADTAATDSADAHPRLIQKLRRQKAGLSQNCAGGRGAGAERGVRGA